MASKRPIKLLGEPVQNEDSKAAEAITPGHLVTFNNDGNLIKHASQGGICAHAFALEREEAGQGIDVAYAVDDTVKVGVFAPGTRVYALIGSGVNVIKGDLMMSAGNGMLEKRTSTNHIVARSLEVKNVTETSRIIVEVM